MTQNGHAVFRCKVKACIYNPVAVVSRGPYERSPLIRLIICKSNYVDYDDRKAIAAAVDAVVASVAATAEGGRE